VTKDFDPLPGFMPRPQYMRVVHNKSDFTGRRWQAKGTLVVKYFGKSPFVDTEATAARARGENRPRRRQPAALTGRRSEAIR
jgi:hypothetical protein